MIVTFPNDLIARPEHHTRDRSIGIHGVPHDDFSMSWTHLGEPPQVGDRFILARASEEG